MRIPPVLNQAAPSMRSPTNVHQLLSQHYDERLMFDRLPTNLSENILNCNYYFADVRCSPKLPISLTLTLAVECQAVIPSLSMGTSMHLDPTNKMRDKPEQAFPIHALLSSKSIILSTAPENLLNAVIHTTGDTLGEESGGFNFPFGLPPPSTG